MNRLTWIAALAGLLLSACGDEHGSVLARNLSTGEISSFPEGAVPPDWAVCSSDDCPVPSTVDCAKLGATVCPLSSECRLKELWCDQATCACAACEKGKTCPPCDCPPPACKYACVPKLPLLCEELSTGNACGARADCEWTDTDCACPAICQDDGKGGCVPCPPCGKSCRTKVPAICQQLDVAQCLGRSDCQWETPACPAICQDDGKGGCLPCDAEGGCMPKNPVKPPCPPQPTPSPTYCPGGKIVETTDANGCVIGFTCAIPDDNGCSAVDAAYIAAVAKAKVCNPYSNLPVVECAYQVDPELGCPMCTTFVSISAKAALQELADLRTKWLALACDKLQHACIAMACQAPKSASCLPSSAGVGVCTNDQP